MTPMKKKTIIVKPLVFLVFLNMTAGDLHAQTKL
jgi:hypothetical protein